MASSLTPQSSNCAIAVPGSATFGGEFLILTGVFASGWAWTVVGAAAIVLAAMYALRLISAVLHDRKGEAVTDSARDLRLPELAFVLPLLGCLIALSIWPNAVASHSFGKAFERCTPLANVLKLTAEDCP